MVELQDLDSLRSVEELSAYRKVVDEGIRNMDAQRAGLPFEKDEQEQFGTLVDQRDQIDRRVKELEARMRIVADSAEDPKRSERAYERLERQYEQSGRDSSRERDIYNLASMRHHPFMDPEGAQSELNDRAKRAIELARFPQLAELRKRTGGTKLSEDDIKAHLENMLVDTQEEQVGDTARHFLLTGGPVYRRAFWKHMTGSILSNEEQRALSLAGSGGGFAIPFALDPSVIPTSNSVVNPIRALARLVTISGANTWQGVTSPAVAATRVAEATEATDNSTTLVQPSVAVTKGHMLIPFSIEVAEDWPQLEAEFGRLIQDAKDDEEGSAFINGNGTAPNPQGIITGATTTFAFAAGSLVTFHAADIYGLEEALPARFRARETFIASRSAYNSIRNIDTAGGAALFLYIAQGLQSQAPTPGNTGAVLLGRPAYEASAMKAKVAGTFTNADKVMVLGDFSYMILVDRIGITVELVPHIFGPVARFPIGQRGLYAYYRNSTKVLSASAFVTGTAAT